MSAAETARTAQALPLSRQIIDERHEFVFAGITGLLLFAPLAFGTTQPWSVFVLEGGADFLFLIWAIQQFRVADARIIWNALFAPSAAFAIIVLLQILSGHSAYGHATLSTALQWCSYAILGFLVIQTLTSAARATLFPIVITIYGSCVAIFAIVQSSLPAALHYWPRVHPFSTIYGPYVNRNHYAGLIEMLIPVPLVASLCSALPTKRRILSAASAAIMAVTIFLSGSRGGMVSLGCEIAFLICMLYSGRQRVRLRILALFVTGTLLLSVWLGAGQIRERLVSISPDASEIVSSTRLAIDRDCVQIFRVKPIMGWGLGTFSEVYPQYRSFYGNFVIDHAHNDYLELLVETGALGLGVLLWFLTVLYKHIFRERRNDFDVHRSLSLAAGVGVTGLLVHSFVDFNLQIPANAAWFIVLCFIATMNSRRKNLAD